MVYPFRLPIVGVAKFCNDGELPCSNMEYEDVVYCPDTMTYKTASQEKEIRRLKEELENKKMERKKSLESIISYFYKRN